MQADVLPSRSLASSGRGQKVIFAESCHDTCRINRNKAWNTMQATILTFLHTLGFKIFFGDDSHVAYQI